jgi:flavin reductase (DIM6/NTAB) family NADH-FMN oxidoreductase RutF
MHVTAHPSIVYLGTPVALLSTINEDGTPNLAPMSSVFCLGWRAYLGLQAASKTTQNILRTGQVVINLPTPAQVVAANHIARTTGSDPIPEDKVARGYRNVKEKFELSGLTPLASETVLPPRALECPIQLEAALEHEHGYDSDGPLAGFIAVLEARITRAHVEQSILMDGNPNRIDPDKWRPLIMSFQEFYRLGPKVHPSKLAEIPEGMYRTPDFARAVGEALPAE